MNALDAASLNRLKWRCRRGLLENDLFIERFFDRHAQRLTPELADGLTALTELPDNDLLDLFLARTQPQGALDEPQVHAVLAMIRTPRIDAAPAAQPRGT